MQYFHPILNRHFGAGEAFVLDENQYPSNWLAVSTPDEISARGFVAVTSSGSRGDDRFYDNAEVLSGSMLTITATPKPIEQVKMLRLQEIADSRYAVETGGVSFGGSIINTERDSQAMLSGALLCVTRNPATIINWKGDGGVWVQLNKEAVEAIADAVSNHVQACFSAEMVKCNTLAALVTFDDVVAFDPAVML
jgi:hypothetical protein